MSQATEVLEERTVTIFTVEDLRAMLVRIFREGSAQVRNLDKLIANQRGDVKCRAQQS